MPRRVQARSENRLTKAQSRPANSNSAIPMLETPPRRFESKNLRRRCKPRRHDKLFAAATPRKSRSSYRPVIWRLVFGRQMEVSGERLEQWLLQKQTH